MQIFDRRFDQTHLLIGGRWMTRQVNKPMLLCRDKSAKLSELISRREETPMKTRDVMVFAIDATCETSS